MAKFNYASGLPRVIKQKGWLAGQITKAFGPRYIGAGFLDSANQVAVEFGEFVHVASGDSYAYEVLPVTSATTAGQLAVVVRDVVGASSLDTSIQEGPKKHLPISLFMGTAGNKGKIVAILGSGTPAVGGQVYVGTGTVTSDVQATVAGVVYATNVASECITATNWKFASTRFAPLVASDVYAVEVEYVG
jgi:hypothetical protein